MKNKKSKENIWCYWLILMETVEVVDVDDLSKLRQNLILPFFNFLCSKVNFL